MLSDLLALVKVMSLQILHESSIRLIKLIKHSLYHYESVIGSNFYVD